jgi:hypothetical protein
MYPVTATFLQALRSAHTATIQVDAYRGGALISAKLPIDSKGASNVTVDSGSAVRRVLNLTLVPQPGLWDLLAPTGTELRPKRGIRYPSGDVEWVPLGRFVVDVQKMGYAPSGSLTLTAPDRWADVQRAQFEAPFKSLPGATVKSEMARLVTSAIPGLTVLNTATSTSVLRPCVWDRDRGQAVPDMGKAIGAEAFFDNDGALVIRDVPTLGAQTPDWLIDASETGVLLGADRERNRQKTYNVVVVASSATDGAAPFAPVIVADNDPTSPTYVGGPFGRVPYFYTSPLLTSGAQAAVAGQAILERVRGLAAQLTLESIVNPALDGGDVVSVLLPAERRDLSHDVERHILDRLTVPLTIDASQPIDTRSSRPDDV